MGAENQTSNREKELARRSLHLSPAVLADELEGIDALQQFPIFITHTKPFETELIMDEIAQFDGALPEGRHVPHDIRWLKAGQAFEV